MRAKRQGWIADPFVVRQLGAVETALRREAGSLGSTRGMYAQLASAKSKRLRPALLLLAGRVGDADARLLVQAATAVELVHEGTLYHDDIVDGAVVRRGIRTAVAAHGPRGAAAAGSALMYRGMELALDLPIEVRRSMARTARRMAAAIVDEVETFGDAGVSLRRRTAIMLGKTAHLFALATYTGATLGHVSICETRALTRFALRFAMAFQLADDLHDLRSTLVTSTEKPGLDLRTGVYTLPVLFALASARSLEPLRRLRALLADIDRGCTAGHERLAAALVCELGGTDRATALVHRWSADARCALDGVEWAGRRPVRASFEHLLERLEAACEQPSAVGSLAG